MNSLELIADLKRQVNELPFDDDTKRDAIVRRTEMVIRRIFGPESQYLQDLKRVRFYPRTFPTDDVELGEAWSYGRDQTFNLLNTMEEELRVFSVPSRSNSMNPTTINLSNRIFIVHGHDNEMKEAVARVLSSLSLEPVILHEQPNRGRTIIEKFSDYADVGFAVVLLSPDDIGRSKTAAEQQAKYRARQNVILELGYFLGKLGREYVVPLYRPGQDFELPSDFSGVLYTEFDNGGVWRYNLVQELQACGYNVDANKLTRR